MKFTLTAIVGEPCFKQGLTPIKTTSQITRTTKTHKGYSSRDDQLFKSHKGLYKVEQPWKVQGLP